eukprot:2532195-Rhodomonas_salina.1
MLAPSLPVFMPISQAFELNDAEDNKQAKLYFDRFRTVGGTEPACRGGVARPVDGVPPKVGVRYRVSHPNAGLTARAPLCSSPTTTTAIPSLVDPYVKHRNVGESLMFVVGKERYGGKTFGNSRLWRTPTEPDLWSYVSEFLVSAI